MKNRKNIAMRCTQEQFEAIKPKLEKSGKYISRYNQFLSDENNYLANNLNKNGIIRIISKSNPYSYEWIEEWDEKVFIKACGIETEDINEEKILTQKEIYFNNVVEDTLSNIQELLLVKGIEYRRNNDPFHNFSVGSQMTGQIPEKVLHGFLLKHLVSYQDMLNDLEKGILPKPELVNEKMNDIIVYFIIQKAMFLDRIENQKTD